MTRRWILALSVLVFSFALSSAVTQDRFPDGPGKPELIKVCNGCHDAQIVLANLKTPSEWAETLQGMAEQGAEASSDEWRLIARYLDAHFALIAINKAPAGELERTMDITSEVAAAVVKFRQDQGAFKSADDVKKVPGVDASKIDALAKRMVF